MRTDETQSEHARLRVRVFPYISRERLLFAHSVIQMCLLARRHLLQYEWILASVSAQCTNVYSSNVSRIVAIQIKSEFVD
jgi:hypothetical protein